MAESNFHVIKLFMDMNVIGILFVEQEYWNRTSKERLSGVSFIGLCTLIIIRKTDVPNLQCISEKSLEYAVEESNFLYVFLIVLSRIDFRRIRKGIHGIIKVKKS